MRKLKLWETVSGRLSISQTDLATYLDISRSLMAMHDIARRELPSAASSKLTRLELAHLGVGKLNPGKQKTTTLYPRLLTQYEETKKSMLEHAEICQYKKLSLQRKLKAMIAQYEKAETWALVVHQLLESITLNKENKGDRLWLEVQQGKVLGRLIRFGNGSQAKLQVKIQVLEAEERAYTNMAEKIL